MANTEEAKGNNLANAATKQAALQEEKLILELPCHLHLKRLQQTWNVLLRMPKRLPLKEKKNWTE